MLSGRFELTETPLSGLILLERRPIGDERGWLERIFCSADLASILDRRPIVQVNRTLTRQEGAVRGMHFQRPPSAETKIVSCLRGAIFDVAVDVREGSRTFLAWHGEVLSGDNGRTLLVPEGFAHGFQVLEGDSEVLYLTTAPWDPAAEAGLNATDPVLAIAWPLPISQRSAKDEDYPSVAASFDGVRL